MDNIQPDTNHGEIAVAFALFLWALVPFARMLIWADAGHQLLGFQRTVRPAARLAGRSCAPPLDPRSALAPARPHGPALFVVASEDRQAPADGARAAHALAGPEGALVLIALLVMQ